ncbi:MAG: hypothetical protein ABW203_05830 [Novosphingobium sp.]
MAEFDNFVAIDWSGAAGERHQGIAVALCAAGAAAPVLIRPGHRWSRTEVPAWLLDDLPPRTLVGLDLGASLPFADRGAFFPGWDESPPDARGLWSLVDRLCAGDAHLGAASFVDHPSAAPHFRRHGGREGAAFGGGAGRMRRTEEAQRQLGCRPTSNFNLVGAAQVGKASLTGMRVLHRLAGRLPVWPFDPVPSAGSVVVEIYTAISALAAGRRAGRSKMRDTAELDAALRALGSAPAALPDPLNDHQCDALVAAAWLRIAAGDGALWCPPGLEAVRFTEGWTFGAP